MVCSQCSYDYMGLYCPRCGAPALPNDPFLNALRMIIKRFPAPVSLRDLAISTGRGLNYVDYHLLKHLQERGILGPRITNPNNPHIGGFPIICNPDNISTEGKTYLICMEEIEKTKSTRRVTEESVENVMFRIDHMEKGRDFELIVAKIIPYLGFDNIFVTPSSGDYGVDILATFQGTKVAIQCKRYSSPLGLAPIQEVFAGMSYYDCAVGAVVTNSDFTPAAKSLAEATGIILLGRSSVEAAVTGWLADYNSADDDVLEYVHG